jgi:lipopolysaccharide/colanic/teichoic acid biosynthesis glycosyltransferase
MYTLIKRSFDILFSLLGLFILSPILIPILILLKLTGEGEVFYRQERIGYKNKPFGILKFATMLKDSANIGSGLVTTRNDTRITPMGKFLRMSKINELPQLWNVFAGDMSFVGPRPLPKSSVAKYSDDVQSILYDNRPGITGIGSLVFRDEEKLVSAFKDKTGRDPLEYYRSYIYPYKGALETWYHQHISFKADIAILFLTFWSIVRSKSNLVYHWFKTLPKKPIELNVDFIKHHFDI